MNDKYVRNLVIFTAIVLLLSGAILFYVFNKQGMTNHKTNNYVNYNINNYVDVSQVVFDNYDNIYNTIDVSKITFKNIDKGLVEEFILKQNELIGYVNGYYNQMNVDDDYIPISVVSSNIKTYINGAILSVCYRLDFNLDKEFFDDNYKSYVIAINIDLVTNKVLTKDEILSKYDYSKSYIADKLFNDDILISKGEVVVDKNTNISLSDNDIVRKKEVYINRIISEFNNIIEMYIEENSLVLVYNTKELKNIFFDDNFDTNIKIRYLK